MESQPLRGSWCLLEVCRKAWSTQKGFPLSYLSLGNWVMTALLGTMPFDLQRKGISQSEGVLASWWVLLFSALLKRSQKASLHFPPVVCFQASREWPKGKHRNEGQFASRRPISCQVLEAFMRMSLQKRLETFLKPS